MNVTKRTNKWQYDFRYNNKRYRKGGFGTKREATTAGNEKYNELTKGLKTDTKLSFIEYYHDWLRVNKENRVSKSSYNRYLYSIKAFEEKFGDIAMNDITQLKYREFLKEYGEGKFLEGGGRKVSKEGRTTNSVQKLHYCLKSSLQDAFSDGYIQRDPTYNAKPIGTKSKQSEEVKFMSLTAFKKLKARVSESNELSHLVIYILICTGARFGEIQKLKYDDILRKDNLIHIPGTKTENADRTIPISRKDMKHITNVLNSRAISFNGYIFNTGANLISNNAVTKVLHRFCLEENIGRYNLHALRHTHCSMLIHEGMATHYISKRLGHSNITVTLSTYSHLLEEEQLQEDEKLLRVLDNF